MSGLVLAKDIDAEMKAEYLDLIRDGYDPGTAGTMLGSTGNQFKKLRNGGYWHDPDFAEAFEQAISSGARSLSVQERVRSMVWARAEDGDWKAIEKLAYAHLPEFEKLRHSNLQVTGQISHQIKAALPHLSDEAVDQAVERLEQKRPVALLPSPDAA